MIENDVEKHLKNRITKIGGLCYKWTSPGTRGVPDRIVLYKGQIYLVELKRPGGSLRKDQRKVKASINQHGIDVYILDTKISVDHFVLKLQVGDLNHEMPIT